MNFDYGRTIFPLLASKPASETISVPRFLGTCFAAQLAGIPILVTAKHVVKGVEKNGEVLVLTTRFGSQPHLDLSGSIVVEHKRIDLAFVLLQPKIMREYSADFKPIVLKDARLELGSDVFTFGYPNSMVQVDDPGKGPVVVIDQYAFKGYVTKIGDEQFVHQAGPVYVLNFPSMPGISGAPLLSIIAGEIHCVGYVIGNLSSSRLIDTKEKNVDGQMIQEHFYESTNFAVACDVKPLVEFEPELRAILKRQIDSQNI